MIIEFSVGNFKSIKELQTISFASANLKSKNSAIDVKNTYRVSDDLSLLKSVAIYGANGSGKSNIIKALLAFLHILDKSMADEKILQEFISPFHFDEESHTLPSFFQIQFILDNKMYRYGFEATRFEIVSEWLYGPADKSETFYFERMKDEEIRINNKYFAEGKGLQKNLKKSNLFLNVVNALNGKLAEQIKLYFTSKIYLSLGVQDLEWRALTLDMLNHPRTKKMLIDFLNVADLGIQELYEENSDKLFPHIKIKDASNTINLEDKILLGQRSIIDEKTKETKDFLYPFDQFESEGTKKIFNNAAAILETLLTGGLFVIDEFDARLHPLLTKKIIEMFNSSEFNTKGAQILFVTHDTNLLDNQLLRRDQIYFAEKDLKGKTHFYSLHDFKGIRNDASFEKDYIGGKYGAIPFLGDFNELTHG